MAFAYTFGISVAILELACYISFYHHIFHHNNTVAVTVVKPAVIKQRNQVLTIKHTLPYLMVPSNSGNILMQDFGYLSIQTIDYLGQTISSILFKHKWYRMI